MGMGTGLWGPPLAAYLEVSESVTAEAFGDRTDHSGCPWPFEQTGALEDRDGRNSPGGGVVPTSLLGWMGRGRGRAEVGTGPRLPG